MELSAEVAAIVARLPSLDAAVIGRIEREREEYRKLYMLAREEIAQLKRGLIGQNADSEASRTPVPTEAEHRFRRKPNTRSDPSRTPIPSEAEHLTV